MSERSNRSESVNPLIAWHHFKVRVPPDWEVTSYSEEDRTGRLEFSTRRGFQGTVSWERCKRDPDLETTILSFLQNNVPGLGPADVQSAADVEFRSVGDFLVGYHTDHTPCQALAFLPGAKKLLRWVFAPAGKKVLDTVWMPILKSFEPNSGDVVEVSIFGLHFFSPEGFSLEDMKIAPANVMLGYESRKKVRFIVRRLGLAGILLCGHSLQEFYRAFLGGQKCVVAECSPATISGMPAAHAKYRTRGEHQMDKFMGRFWENGDAWLWHDEDENRLYSFEQIGPPKRPLAAFNGVFPYMEPHE